MDKLKSAAQEVAVEARKMGVQAQGKLSEARLKRKMDDSARLLGYLYHQERTRGGALGDEADALVHAISELEVQIAQAVADTKVKEAAAEAHGPQSSSSSDTPSTTPQPPPPPPQGSP
ncbi:MAG TPA: hypothetical protein VFS38_01200 [Actinomycetota bacterium]|nr:hypothetical protein [Actinomycetota bacterium]